MIKSRLIMALDTAARKNVTRELYSYRKQGKWYICSSGPKYCNVKEVTEYDEEGLQELLRHERPYP